MRIRIVLSALVIAMVGWAGCRNLPTSPEAKDVLNTLSISPDSTPQIQSGYIYWTNVAWGFVEKKTKLSCFIHTGSITSYQYWLTIRTEDYEPNWPPEMIVNGKRIFKDTYSTLEWFVEATLVQGSKVDHITVLDRPDANVRVDTIIGGDPNHRIMWTGYTFQSCYLDYTVDVRVGRGRYWLHNGRRIHYWITPPHTVRVRPLW